VTPGALGGHPAKALDSRQKKFGAAELGSPSTPGLAASSEASTQEEKQ